MNELWLVGIMSFFGGCICSLLLLVVATKLDELDECKKQLKAELAKDKK